jgi:coenzyme F420-reducing hydrogenase gamma subunit
MNQADKPTVAVHKFSSCDGCQLAFLNLGEDLLALADVVDIRHFVEAGLTDEDAKVDIAFVEGSVSTSSDTERLRRIRANSRYLVTIGACATAGGLQALRNLHDTARWTAAIYASPEYIDSLDQVSPIRDVVKVDLELWGCPVNSRQVVATVQQLLFGVQPLAQRDTLCLDCKRAGNPCVLVSKGEPCLGPVSHTGCGALCPRFGRACYGCYGPLPDGNTESLAECFVGLGLAVDAVARRFALITNAAEPFAGTAARWREKAK